jgi:hypothetical protein
MRGRPWLNSIVAVGHGYAAPDGAIGYRVFAVS